jgi:glycosyltransferase involved in cell wall biosynthesis
VTKLGVLALAEPRHGGTFQYTLSMLEALRCLHGELKITLYCSSDHDHFAGMGFPLRRVASTRFVRLMLVLRAVLGLRCGDPFVREDIVLAPTYSPLLFHTRKPFVCTLHDVQERYYPHYFSGIHRAWRKFVHGRLVSKAARVICESEFVRQDIIGFFQARAEQVSVIPAPPIRSNAPTDGQLDEVREKFLLPDQYFLYPSQFWPHKNHLRLVDAFARLACDFPNCQLILTGIPRDEFGRVFKRVRELGLGSRIRHVGYVEQEDLPALYKLATALVMPSLFESISIPVLEAFQYGTPVCAASVVALPEQVGDAGLLFDPMSVESIAEAMRTLISDPELCMRLRQKGKERVEEMTYEPYAREIKRLLDSVH